MKAEGPPAVSPENRAISLPRRSLVTALRARLLNWGRGVLFLGALSPDADRRSRIQRIRLAARVLLGREGAARLLTVYPDDIFVVSYPKSGNTWTRFLIGNLISTRGPVDFSIIDEVVPDIEAMSDAALRRVRRPRILKSHQYFDPRYKRVICVVRDPRDVAVSYYHHHIKYRYLEEHYPLDRFVSHFIAGDLDAYGSWGDNVGSWLGARRPGRDFLLLRFEDMLRDTTNEMRKIALFLGVVADDAGLKRVVELSSAENMRRLERSQSRVMDSLKHSRQDRLFVRAARLANWHTELSSGLARQIEEAWGSVMQSLGYL